MKSDRDLQLDIPAMRHKEMVGLDPKIILSLLFRNWYWFVIFPIISLFFARFYIGHTMPVFRTSTTVLINDNRNRSVVDNSSLLEGFGLPGGMQNIENQIMILRSRDLTAKTLEKLPFEIEYYLKTIRNNLPIYPDPPVRIFSEGDIPLPRDIEFEISYLGDNKFTLTSGSEYFPFKKTASFGDTIEVQGGSFRIECMNGEYFKSESPQAIYFVNHSTLALMNSYNQRINVEVVIGGGSILNISIEGANRVKDADFLNKLIEGFQQISLERKNAEAIRRIEFIDAQLIGISDSLLLTENKLQQFRSSHRVMDLSAQGQAIIGQVTSLENEKARLSLEANYYDYLADYLEKNILVEAPIVPITMGITDPGLTRLVNELAELQRQYSTRGAGEMNPLQRNLEQRINSTKNALVETLNGLRRANSLARSDNQSRINQVNSQASALPITERQLLGIERQFTLNNELYTFLLETRAEQQMQKASNRADCEVIDPADPNFSVQIAPNSTRINFLALIAGLGIPSIIILLGFIFNTKIREEEIQSLSRFPLIASIPHVASKTNNIIFENPSSNFAEAYRLLRSKLQFFTKEKTSPVILITSSMPGDGKTFTSINLASVYSLLGQKTILLGFDLRKPRIFQDFNLQNEKGLSTWLIGKDKLEDIIQKTDYDNLSIISAGPVPPNPSELIALHKTVELIDTLKRNYDYIIIDSSPVGIVSDTIRLAALADACLIVVRPNKTLRDIYRSALNEVEISEVKSAGLIINDVVMNRKRYGYSEKYGYTKNEGRRRLFRFHSGKSSE